MLYRSISDLRVSELSFGNFIFGSFMWGKTPADAPEGIRLQNLAYDLGINFFDTADAYDNGRAEELLRPTIEYAGRSNIILSTKFGYDFYNDPGTPGSHRERHQNFSPAFLTHALEQSLRRLHTDYIDLYQAHNIKLPSMQGPTGEALLDTLANFQKSGKIRHWGIALGPAIGFREEGIAALQQWTAPPINCQSVQTVFNMLEQHPGRELAQTAAAHHAAIIARVPHSSGILQDLYSPDEKFTDHRKFRDRNWLVYGLQKIEQLRPIQHAHHCTMAQLAIQWLLTHPAVASVQPNITTEAELRDLTAACNGHHLTPAEMTHIQSLVESDFNLGPAAHACDLKSSLPDTPTVPSSYQPTHPIPTLARPAILSTQHSELSTSP